MHQIARNLNNVVFLLDLTQPNTIGLITNSIKTFIARGLPIRFGIVPIVSEEADDGAVEAHVAQVLWYLVDAVGRSPAMNFLAQVRSISPPFPVPSADHAS
jgi:UDP-glucose:glycoprotein glucosyltransferase